MSSLPTILFMFLLSFIRYLLVAGALYYIFWVKLRDRFEFRKLTFSKLKKFQIKTELKNSLTTTLVYGLVLGTVLNRHVIKSTKLYTDVSLYGWGYLLFSCVLVFVLHDLYFYLTHRLLHTPFLYRNIHLTHHQSVSPTPWASYSFHPIEAFITIGFMPLLVFTIPMHMYVMIGFGFAGIVLNAIGHLGYEVMPKGFEKTFSFKLFNTPTHHTLHHKYQRCHYSLYFNYLDRWLNTNHSTYSEELEKVLAREATPVIKKEVECEKISKDVTFVT